MRNASFEDAHARYILENIQDIVWEANPNLVFTYVNPQVEVITGYQVEEVLGRDIFTFPTKESRKQIFDQWRQNMTKRINGSYKDAHIYDMEFVCKAGKTIWFEVSAKPMFRDDTFQGYIGVSRDVTARKRAELDLLKCVEELRYKNNILDEWAMLNMLTGTYNRRKSDSYARMAVEAAEQYQKPFSVLMFDVDNFKQINDS